MTKKRQILFSVIRGLLAILIALLVATLLIFLSADGDSFAEKLAATGGALKQLLVGPLFRMGRSGTKFDFKRLTDILASMIPIIFTGLSVCVMFSANQFNLGSEGGIMLGAFSTAMVAVYVPMAAAIHPIVGVLAGGLAVAVMMLLPALLKTKLDVSEMVCSLMLNYIVMYFIKYLMNTYLADKTKGQIQSYEFLETSKIAPLIDNGSKLSWGFVVAIACVVLIGLFIYNTRWGYTIRMIGINQAFAKYSGMKVATVIVLSQVLGGFLAIMAISLVFGLIAGIPLVNTTDADGNTVSGIANVIGAGFSSTFSSIGIVIIFGALVGTLLESTGAALKMADCVVKLVGKKHPELAIELMGWIVSIPVFCDSGFVVLNPIRKAMARRTGASSVAMSVALSMGLYISHCFIPPTPGPIAAAGTLGCGDNLLLVMGLGALCSIPPLVAGYFFAKYIGKKVKAADDIVADGDVKTYEQLVAEFGKLPSGWLAFAPIVLPIILMGLASAFSMAGVKADFISFLGTPIIALAVGCIIAIISLFAANKGKDFYKLTDDTLKTVGPILFVTAAGGVLGKVIASSDMVNFIKANAEIFESIGIFFPFLLAAILKSAQGSSTVAITTTAGIVAPLLPVLGLDSPALSCLTVIAIGAGAMTVSHANDSYFWVVTNFGEMTPQDGYKTQTLGTLVIGVVSIIGVFIVSLFLR